MTLQWVLLENIEKCPYLPAWSFMFVLTNILGHDIQGNINKKLIQSVYLRHVNF